MKAAESPKGQSVWLDNITRRMLDEGQVHRLIERYSVSGLTSNPSTFHRAIATGDYDEAIRQKGASGVPGEAIFFELAIEDIQRAAYLFRAIHERTGGDDGWVSLEVSPLLIDDPIRTAEEATSLLRRVGQENVFIKIPGTPAGLSAVEQCVASGIPVNVTLLFSANQYRAAAESYMRGLEHRLEIGLKPTVACAASLYLSAWDAAVARNVPPGLKNKLGIAISEDVYRAYVETLKSERWRRLEQSGARCQRLVWARTTPEVPGARSTLYLKALFAPSTVITMSESTLATFIASSRSREPMPADGNRADEILSRFTNAGIDTSALAIRLQTEGAALFELAWRDLLARIEVQAGRGR